MGEESTEVVVPSTIEAQSSEPGAILALAVQQGADPAIIEKMMDLKERWEANEAKKLYVKALTAFKQECPPVLPKDGVVDFKAGQGRVQYRHATLGGIVTKITALMGEHGLSVSWSTGQEDGNVIVSCHITHEAGHCETVTLSGPPDDSGNKNRIQQVGSTVTYLQRYTLLASLGLATAEQDDDGVAANGKAVRHVTAGQAQEITEQCKRLGVKKADWTPDALGLFPAGVKRLRDMSEAGAAALIERLAAAKSKADLEGNRPARPADPLMNPPVESLPGIDEPEPEPKAGPEHFDRDAAIDEINAFAEIPENAMLFELACRKAITTPVDWMSLDDKGLSGLLSHIRDHGAAKEG